MKARKLPLTCASILFLFPLTLTAAQFCTNAPGGKFRLVLGTVVVAPNQFDIFGYNGGFTAYQFDDVDLVWIPHFPTNSPGGGFLIHLHPSVGNISYCFPEPTKSPTLPLKLGPGMNLVCCQSNIPATYEAIVGAAPAPGTRLLRLKPDAAHAVPFTSDYYSIYTYLPSGWSPATPIADPGEAVFVSIAPFIQNPAIVNGHMEFDVQSPAGSQATIEKTDSLVAPQWQTLTTFTAGTGVTHVTDPDDISRTAERYYRARL